MKRTRRSAQSYVVCLDSRSRMPGTTLYEPTFQLTKPISHATTARVKCVQFANTLWNVTDTSNTIALAGLATGKVTPGYYTAEELLAVINGFGIGISLTYVPQRNALLWNVGEGVVDVASSTMREALGLEVGRFYTGEFQTKLFLASPMNVDFVCAQLQSTCYTYSGRQRESNTQALISVPVLAGYGDMVLYMPTTLANLDVGGTQIASLDFRVVDSMTGNLIREFSHWSMQIEVFTS